MSQCMNAQRTFCRSEPLNDGLLGSLWLVWISSSVCREVEPAARPSSMSKDNNPIVALWPSESSMGELPR